MYINFRKIISITLFFVLMITPLSYISNIKGNIIYDEASAPNLNIVKSDRQGIIVDIILNGFISNEILINDELFQEIIIPDYGFLDEIGKPKIPSIRFFLALPPDSSNLQLNYINSTCNYVSGFNIIPNQEPTSEIENNIDFTINNTFYSLDEYYPSEIVNILSQGWIGDYKYIHLEVCPIIFNPKLETIGVYNFTKIEISYNSNYDSCNAFSKIGFDNFYKSLILNYNSSVEWYKNNINVINAKDRNVKNLNDTSNRAGLLIITTDLFYSSLGDFIKWKDRKGFETYIANISQVYSEFPAGSNQESIKYFIQFSVNNWSRAPSHILLIGDVEFIPTYYYQGSTPTDHWYSCVIGGDYFSDVLIGRISVKNNSELLNILNKIIEYERNPYLNETAWYKKAMLVSDSGYFEVTSDWVYNFLSNYSYTLDKFYDSLGTATNSNIANALNEGRAIANYRGHGSTTGWGTGYFYNSDVLALTNGKKLPIVISPTCSTGHFDDPSTDCFGETWLKAINGGGISFWGSSRVSYGGYNDELDMGVYKAIFNDNITDFGGFTNKAKMYMINVYGTSSMALLELHLFNVIGDSTLDAWTNVPAQLNVEFPAMVPPGSPSFHIKVMNNNTGIENACVCLQKENELYAIGYTNTSGEISFNLSGLNPGFMNLTVTKHNFIPFTSMISVNSGININNGWNFISIPFNNTINKTEIMLVNNGTEYIWEEAISIGLIGDFIFGWDKINQTYVMTDLLKPGHGYWLYSSNQSELWMQGSNLMDGYITSVFKKWNIISTPDVNTLNKNNITVVFNGINYNWTDAVNNNLINNYLFGWNTISQAYEISDDINPGCAYWMYSYQNCDLKSNN